MSAINKSDSMKNGKQPNYSFASNGLLSATIPEDLRKDIAKADDLTYKFAPLTYRTGITIDALYVGQRVNIPGSGRYEMYLVFTLVNQGATLELVQNALLLTGIVLLLLIALITWLVAR